MDLRSSSVECFVLDLRKIDCKGRDFCVRHWKIEVDKIPYKDSITTAKQNGTNQQGHYVVYRGEAEDVVFGKL